MLSLTKFNSSYAFHHMKNIKKSCLHATRFIMSTVDDTSLSSHHKFSVAPMMEYTDRHQRYMFSLLSSQSVLYTEMVTTNALVRNSDDVDRFLEADFHLPNPIVLQLGGSDPKQMYEATKLAREYGYKEININCGCPSDKVAGKGSFGAALMMDPDLVSELSNACKDGMNGKAPTIKCRIGVNDNASYHELQKFIEKVSTTAGVTHFIVHARKAVLGANFSPHDNRSIPPLKYDYVYNLVKDFPNLSFSINGGVHTYDDVITHLNQGVTGVMVGRSVINIPYYWKNIDSKIYHSNDPKLERAEILESYGNYALSIEHTQGSKARRALMKPVLTLFTGEPNGKRFRAALDKLIRDESLNIKQVFDKASEVLKYETLWGLPIVPPVRNSSEVDGVDESLVRDKEVYRYPDSLESNMI